MSGSEAQAVDLERDAKALYEVYAASLDAMNVGGPQELDRRLRFEAESQGRPELADPAALTSYLEGRPPSGDRLLVKLKRTLAAWDAESASSWTGDTVPRTEERRQRVYELLDLDGDLKQALDAAMPVASDRAIVISREFKKWYGRVSEEREPFYWKHYADYLAAQGWGEDSIAALDLNTTRVVERLADPERADVYQAKGLVVGYVQSGKTANFTGVAAKAIDAGYRLLIVLTGTTNLLRAQTQRRIDKELVGDENLMRGIDPDDEEAVLAVDYHGDPDRDEFVCHGGLPSKLGASDVFRLTTFSWDYRSLKQGISSLDFERLHPARPLNAPENLHRLPTRIVIVKKYKSVLENLVRDLRHITAKLEDIPALIIDDESDQASINTSDPRRWNAEKTERTTINKLISELLKMLKRSQYVGYTATPFANVFVDPDDAVDIFPRDFILSLDRPPGYMGPGDFHDLDQFPEGESRTPENSNEKAFVRAVYEEEAEEKMVEAIDMFVLTGAVKLFREETAADAIRFKHHTMLVHESVKQEDHKQLAEEIRQAWKVAGYFGPRGHGRLEALFEGDLAPVMEARAGNDPMPSYAEVKPYVAEVVARIEGHGGDPVLIVNGDKEASKEEVDFQSRPVWRILVGGTKLSRGFTVEGLTVSYYRRATKQTDTLMQMGRWFGFRSHYRDLVRLYIDRGSAAGPSTYDLYEAFEAACRSEELFRAELSRYADLEDGVPQVTPREVPPLVAQHLGWLKPAASNKMYNAELVERRSPGVRLEPSGYPEDQAKIAANVQTLLPLADGASEEGEFRQGSPGSRGTFPAFHGTVDHGSLVRTLGRLEWLPSEHFTADLVWLEGLDETQIEDWTVVLPQHVAQGPYATLGGRTLSVFRRGRRRGSLFGAISDPKHRPAAEGIAGIREFEDPLVESLHRERRGAVLLYPVVEYGPRAEVPSELGLEQVVLALSIFAPLSTGSPDDMLVRFRVRDSGLREEPIVDA